MCYSQRNRLNTINARWKNKVHAVMGKTGVDRDVTCWKRFQPRFSQLNQIKVGLENKNMF